MTWVKKIAKIFRTMIVLENKKNTMPLMTPSFINLIDFIKVGAYANLIEPPKLSQIESDVESDESLSN